MGFGRGRRPRQKRPNSPLEEGRSLMTAQAPLKVAQRKRRRAKYTIDEAHRTDAEAAAVFAD